MRFALITIDSSPDIAGRALALRQLDFALAAGVERVIGVGNGASPQMIALRHTAEAAGVRFHGVAGAHGLLGAVGTADELLVLAPGLLPEAPEGLEMLAGGPAILTLPAAPGIAAGFERIDQDRAWAGALLMPGGMVERMSQLPADFAPASALLRIALQGRVPLHTVAPQLASGGGWIMVGDDAMGQGAAWLKRHEAPVGRGDVTGGIVRIVMRRVGLWLLGKDRAPAALLAGFAMVTMLALGLVGLGQGARGYSVTALMLLALAMLPARLHSAVARLHRLPFDGEARTVGLLAALVDAALFAALALALALAAGESWPERLFGPCVLLLAARLAVPARWPRYAAWITDRLVLATLCAICAALGLLPAGIMLLSLILLSGQLIWHKNTVVIPLS